MAPGADPSLSDTTRLLLAELEELAALFNKDADLPVADILDRWAVSKEMKGELVMLAKVMASDEDRSLDQTALTVFTGFVLGAQLAKKGLL